MDKLLLETGDAILQEISDFILLEQQAASGGGSLIACDSGGLIVS